MNSVITEKTIGYYKETKPQLTEILDAFSSIGLLLRQYSSQLPSVISMSQESAIGKLKSGKYLLEDIKWTIKREEFNKVASDLLKLVNGENRKTNNIETLLSLPTHIPTELPGLISAFTKNQQLTPNDKNLVNYVLWLALRAFYQKEAERFKTMDYQLYWAKSTCPVCGNLPKISRLKKDTGQRQFACYLCWTEWTVSRIICPYCLNTSPDKFEYFYADDNKAYRVDICKACNNYLKTIDEKQLGRETILDLEDIITYHLDTLAISEGYQSPFPYGN